MDKVEDFIKTVEKIAQDTDVKLPSGYGYRYAPYTCWKCGTEIVVFKWCHGRIEGEIEKPPVPIPRTIQERYTSTSDETYWANTCIHCDSVQGDWFLSVEPDSPFFTLREVEDSKVGFDNDMASIADYYFEQLEEAEEQIEIEMPKAEQEPKQKELW